MFRTSFTTTVLLLTVAAAPVMAQSGLLRGTVVDSNDQPLAGVKITVTSDDLTSYRKTLTTKKDGGFVLRFQVNQVEFRFNLQFEKPGYQSFIVPFSPTMTRQMSEEFVMEPAETQVVETRGDLGAVVTGSSNEAIEAFNAGVSSREAGDLTSAQSHFEQALAADPSLVPASLALAGVHLDQGDYEQVVAYSQQALDLAPGNADGLRFKHQALLALGRDEEAELVSAELEQAEDAAATALRLYNEGGQAFQADDKVTALEKFKRAAELDPTLTDAHHAVATLEFAAGNHEASATAAEQALEQGSDDVRTLRVLYDAYQALGRTEELTEIAPRLAAVDPDFGGPKLIEQAAQLWNGGNTEQAAALSRTALSIDDGLAKAHYFIGLDHLAKGENAEARAALTRFLELAPDDAEAETARGMLEYIE